MCEKDIYKELRPDGRTQTFEKARSYCNCSMGGDYCPNITAYHHPTEQRRPTYNQYPPTPPMSSHSGNTSDSERPSKRKSEIYIKVNGPKVADYPSDSERSSARSSEIYANSRAIPDSSRRRSSRHERQTSSDRLSYEGSSSLSRSPLRSPTFYRSIPSSPVADVHDGYSSSYRDSMVDERDRPSSSHHPSIKVEIVNHDSTHRRKGSSSKTSSSRDSDEDERKHRRQRRASVHFEEPPKVRKEKDSKKSEIARANDAIANRTAVPHTPKTPYRRGSVSIGSLVSATEPLRIDEDKLRRRQERKALKEREREEANLQKERERADADQKKRLKERMNSTPRRPDSTPRRPVYYSNPTAYF
ncbi:hypothetical protein F5Y18DRAFT_62105 [Xylariaceae sp. FL1019]|nr:hypothetical protein F5Y18DRAFT_62105 [Xylariaceae sp. FL1019]